MLMPMLGLQSSQMHVLYASHRNQNSMQFNEYEPDLGATTYDFA